MAPKENSNSLSPALIEYLNSRKNEHAIQSTSTYHSFIFCCDRFRDVFKLPDFGSRDLDLALLLESDTKQGYYQAPLVRKLVMALGRPFVKGAFNLENYNLVLHDIFKRKLDDMPNPLGEDASKADIHRLPGEVKLWLMNFLLDLRMRKDESETVDTFCEADALRVLDLGEDAIGNRYFYFGEFRIAIELKERRSYPHAINERDRIGAPWTGIYDEYTEGAQFLCAAETREQWRGLIDLLEGAGKFEKAIAYKIKNLFETEQELHLTELNRRTKLKNEESRMQAKQEMEAMKTMGVVRASGRIQAKEKMRKEKEEEERQRRIDLGLPPLESADSEDGSHQSQRAATSKTSPQRLLTREERRLQREAVVAEQMMQNPINGHNNDVTMDDEEEEPTPANGVNGQANASDEKIDDPEVELLSTSSSVISASYLTQPKEELKRKHSSTNPTDDYRPLKIVRLATKNESGEPVIQQIKVPNATDYGPYYKAKNTKEFKDFTLTEYYDWILSALDVNNTTDEYQRILQISERFFSKEFAKFLVQANKDLVADGVHEWPAYDDSLAIMANGVNSRRVNGRLNLILLVDELIGRRGTRIQMAVLLRAIRFMHHSWRLLFKTCSKEDDVALRILEKMADDMGIPMPNRQQ